LVRLGLIKSGLTSEKSFWEKGQMLYRRWADDVSWFGGEGTLVLLGVGAGQDLDKFFKGLAWTWKIFLKGWPFRNT